MSHKQDQETLAKIQRGSKKTSIKQDDIPIQIDMQKSTYAFDSQEFQADQDAQTQSYQQYKSSNQQAKKPQIIQKETQEERKQQLSKSNSQASKIAESKKSRIEHQQDDEFQNQQEEQCLQFESQKNEQRCEFQQREEQRPAQGQENERKKSQTRIKQYTNRVQQEIFDSDENEIQSGQLSKQPQKHSKHLFESQEEESETKELASKLAIQNGSKLQQSVLISHQKKSETQRIQKKETNLTSQRFNNSGSLQNSQREKYLKQEWQQNQRLKLQEYRKLSAAEQDKYPTIEFQYKNNSLPTKQLSYNQGEHLKASNKEKRPLVQYHQSQQLVQVQLIMPQKNQNTTTVKFLNYSVEYFLKIQTQVFTIEVFPPATQPQNQIYRIKRRFSDFVFLYDAIITNHLGFIIYPFPQKTLESFIKLKLNIHRQQGQKIQLIEKRMSQLEKFMKFLLNHPQLRFSQQLIIFIKPDQVFEIQRKRIQSYVQQLKELENGNNLKNIVGKGIGFISSYLSKSVAQKKSVIIEDRDLQFAEYLEKVQSLIEKINSLLEAFTELEAVEKANYQYSDIQTDVDALLKLCAKHSSAKQYNRYLKNWISNEMVQFLELRFKQLKQIEQQLNQRSRLVQLVKQSSLQGQMRDRYEKLQRRVLRFDRNFSSGWDQTVRQLEHELEAHSANFWKVWRQHQVKMIKIWQSK